MKNKSFYVLLIALSIAFVHCKEATSSAPAKGAAFDIAARNKATALKVNAAINERRFDDGVLFYATNYVEKSVKQAPGRAGVKAAWENAVKLWPDSQIVVEQMVAEGDWVLVKYKAKATHTQVVMGVQPTNKKLEADSWDAFHFDKDGLIFESHNTIDNLAMMQQLGLLPTGK